MSSMPTEMLVDAVERVDQPEPVRPSELVDEVELLRLAATRELNPEHRAQLGQFMTPPPVARRMASFFEVRRPNFRLLDAGAGVGSLTAAWVAEMLSRPIDRRASPSQRTRWMNFW